MYNNIIESLCINKQKRVAIEYVCTMYIARCTYSFITKMYLNEWIEN